MNLLPLHMSIQFSTLSEFCDYRGTKKRKREKKLWERTSSSKNHLSSSVTRSERTCVSIVKCFLILTQRVIDSNCRADFTKIQLTSLTEVNCIAPFALYFLLSFLSLFLSFLFSSFPLSLLFLFPLSPSPPSLCLFFFLRRVSLCPGTFVVTFFISLSLLFRFLVTTIMCQVKVWFFSLLFSLSLSLSLSLPLCPSLYPGHLWKRP